MQGGSRRPEKGQVGNYGIVDSGEMAGMPREQKPPSSSPKEQHSDKREGVLPFSLFIIASGSSSSTTVLSAQGA